MFSFVFIAELTNTLNFSMMNKIWGNIWLVFYVNKAQIEISTQYEYIRYNYFPEAKKLEETKNAG